jgi:ribosomal protein L7Ae-like RNA K-turn-binding protein
MSSAIRYIAIARKAGAVAMGEEGSGAAVRAGKGRLLVLAKDASENARSRAAGFVYGRNTPVVSLPYTKSELAEASGSAGCSMAVFTDTGLARAFLDALSGEYGGYAETAAALAVRDEKESKRRREAATHEKRKRAAGAGAKAMRRNKP